MNGESESAQSTNRFYHCIRPASFRINFMHRTETKLYRYEFTTAGRIHNSNMSSSTRLDRMEKKKSISRAQFSLIYSTLGGQPHLVQRRDAFEMHWCKKADLVTARRAIRSYLVDCGRVMSIKGASSIEIRLETQLLLLLRHPPSQKF